MRRGAATPRRARELRAVLADDVLVVEDDHLGPVAGTPWHTLAAGRRRWATVRSVSKWLGPDLRLAVVAGDEATLARVEGRQSLGPGWVSGIVQRLAAQLWSDAAVMAGVAAAAQAYAERRDALAGAARRAASPPSGINLWVPGARTRTPPSAPCSPTAGRSPPAARTASPAAPRSASPPPRSTSPRHPRLAAAVERAVTPPRRTRAA